MASKKANAANAAPAQRQRLITDAEVDRASRDTGHRLAAQERVSIMIAADDGDPVWRGSINGYDYSFPKGQLVEVPHDVARLIENSAQVTYQRQLQEQKLKGNLNLGAM